MAEVLVAFEEPVRDQLGAYQARAVGRLAEDRMWEGWIEFVPVDGNTEVLVTGAESRQPEKEHLTYWATGLTHVFLEGALRRARQPITVRVRTVELPLTDHPAARGVNVTRVMPPGPEPVLDPFDIGSRNLDQLRQELTALNRPRLLNIIAAYDLNPGATGIDWMSDAQLVHFIVVAVETQLAQRSR
jgi:hypothetical protein